MEDRFVELFNEELTHVRRMADEFKYRHPQVAERLQLGQDQPDPYVQQLLDGFAFLAARVQLKLESEFPRFTESLLQNVYPDYLAPLPSMAIVAVEPDYDDAELASGPIIPRDTHLSSILQPGDSVRCIFRTSQDLQILPIKLIGARYYSRDLAEIDTGWARETGARAAIQLRLQATAGLAFNQIDADRLLIHLLPGEELPGILYEQMLAHSTAVVAQSITQPPKTFQVTRPAPVRGPGFEDREALLPAAPRTFSGYRVLREYFAFPNRFLFVEVAGLRPAFQQCATGDMDLIFPLREPDSRLENRVQAKCFALHCVPAINLFKYENIIVDLKEEREEHLLVPDRTKTLEYEVYSVEAVVGCPKGTNKPDERYQFKPFYFSSEVGANAVGYFNTRRLPRNLNDQEIRDRPVSEYRGSEVYLSLAGEAAGLGIQNLKALSVTALCTNRHIPKRYSEIQFDRDIGAPVKSLGTIAKTPPRASHVEGRMNWRVISHLALNYRSLLADDGARGKAALQELLRLYVADERELGVAQIRALKKAAATTILRRVETPGPISYARGLGIDLEFDEKPFADTGVFLLGAVLDRFFSRYVTMNSFVQTTLTTEQRGKVFQWPISKGLRQML